MGHDTGFTSIAALRRGPSDPEKALAEIRRIYFKTTKETVEHDLAHAIELLKSLPDEAHRERAHVYMEGLAEMRKEWSRRGRSRRRERSGKGHT